MSFISQAVQSKPASVVLKTISVLDIATEHQATDVQFISNPKNCGFDYLWFENANQDIIKVKIGQKAADALTATEPKAMIAELIKSKMPIYVNTERQDGTPLDRPVFTFGPIATDRPAVKVSLASVLGIQQLEGKKN